MFVYFVAGRALVLREAVLRTGFCRFVELAKQQETEKSETETKQPKGLTAKLI